jgi:hypothetical protein
MEKSYTTLLEHIELLSEKGYLHGDFKPAYKMGGWLKELEEQYELARYTAHADDLPVRFEIELRGKFNAQLDTVQFRFIYKYDPDKESLQLIFVGAKLDNMYKPYILKDSTKLKEAEGIYHTLSQRESYQNPQKRFDRMIRETRPKGFRL